MRKYKNLKSIVLVLISMVLMLTSFLSVIKIVDTHSYNRNNKGNVAADNYSNLPAELVANCDDGITEEEYNNCYYFKIGTADGFINFTKAVISFSFAPGNASHIFSFYFKNVFLSNDIDLGGYNFIPIGLEIKDRYIIERIYFCGTFNGQGYTIKNIKCNSVPSGSLLGLGLFWGISGSVNEYIDEDSYAEYLSKIPEGYESITLEEYKKTFSAQVCNLRIENFTIDLTSQNKDWDMSYDIRDIGAVAAFVGKGASINNVEVSGFDVFLPGLYGDGVTLNSVIRTQIGGIFSSTKYNNYGKIIYCKANIENVYVENFNIKSESLRDSIVAVGIGGAVLNPRYDHDKRQSYGEITLNNCIFRDNGTWTFWDGKYYEADKPEIYTITQERENGICATVTGQNWYADKDDYKNDDFTSWGNVYSYLKSPSNKNADYWFCDETYNESWPRLAVFITPAKYEFKFSTAQDKEYGEIKYDDGVFISDGEGGYYTYQPNTEFPVVIRDNVIEVGDKVIYAELINENKHEFVKWDQTSIKDESLGCYIRNYTAKFRLRSQKVLFTNDSNKATMTVTVDGENTTYNGSIEIESINSYIIDLVRTVESGKLIYTFKFLNSEDKKVVIIYKLKDNKQEVTDWGEWSKSNPIITSDITITPTFNLKQYNVGLS